MFGRTVFTAADQTFLTDDLILAALSDGRWDVLRHHVRAALELDHARGGAQDAELDAASDQAAADFRYARDLISAEDTTAWLLARGLSVEDWYDALRRRHLEEEARARPIMPPAPPDPSDFVKSVWAEFVVSGMAAELAELLARQAVAQALLPGEPPAPDPAALAEDLALVREHFPHLDDAEARTRLGRLMTLASAVSRLAEVALTPEALRKELEHRALDLVHLSCEVALFDDAPRAREAALCVREDGLSLAEAAEEAHTEVQEAELWIDELPPELRTPLRSAGPGELLGPLAWEGQPALVYVHQKHRPSLDDPDVRERLEQGLLDRTLEERMEALVTWQLKF